MLEGAATIALGLAAIPALLVVLNLLLYRPPRPAERRAETMPAVAVLIPARDEERNIARAVEALQRNRQPELSIVVMDDHSEDRTAPLVQAMAAEDPRVRLLHAPPLAPGWSGKTNACRALAAATQEEIMIFVDADVFMAADGVARIVDYLQRSGADLISGFPRQETGSFVEKLIIPLIHFVLLGYLPMIGAKLSRHPMFAAGCGQLMAVRRSAYERVGGHRTIKATRHDGIGMARAFRRAGLKTDLFDATPVASSRLYHNAREVWNGLAKNANEAMATPAAILPWTILLLGGHVMPLALLPGVLLSGTLAPAASTYAAIGVALGFATRALLAWRFQQPWSSVLLHPLGILALVAVQWYALGNQLLGRPIAWKGRVT